VRTTVTIDDELLRRAETLSATKDRGEVIREGVRTLVRVESARRLAALGGDRAGRVSSAEAPRRWLDRGRLVILVDTSVWIDHFHRVVPALVDQLERDEVGCHPLVIEELALGSIPQRDQVLEDLDALHGFPVLTHHELLSTVGRWRLWGRGLSAVDVHLLGSVALRPGAMLWTRDRRMNLAAEEMGVRPVSSEQ
jgi:predicted nucleic acid-binding protein